MTVEIRHDIRQGVRVALPRTIYSLVMTAPNDQMATAQSDDFDALQSLRLQLKALGYDFNTLTAIKEP